MARVSVTVTAARSVVAARYDRGFAEWSVGAGTDVVELPLHPPTEAAALADQPGAIQWAKAWRDAGLGDALTWRTRQWASLGAQSVPERLRLGSAADIARFGGRSSHWARLKPRAEAILSEYSGTPNLSDAVRRSARALAELPAADVDRLTLVLRWLAAHPDSGLYIRQLPIRGVDTKWVSTHRGLVERLFAAATGRQSLGLAGPPVQVRLRFLDPSMRPGGLVDVSAPVEELAGMPLHPLTVFVFENLESVVAMPPVPGAVVIHGSGYAVDRLDRIPWVRGGRVVYWGDLDSHGLGIVNRLRAALPEVSVVLMDLETLHAHRDLWVQEPTPNPGAMEHLRPEEHQVLAELRALGHVRLEQERIPWQSAVETLRTAATAS